ncbi:general secretion pathway protein GspK [Oceanimonas baumannii]|uniref:General secretion pathway protein GspK n=1 Tax=Oceanimonas baumannii TaxID=129578 RepID=A0A235CDX7_9GAMM|nr:type II secretion system protein GspK [Oceanimonas baumannii]OYD22733.1 general secretion pathway protein GspK [Oceanimonas baumannii]TDW57698.1 general secretion pathway protein K [Oceanimonas baumannii]
MLSSNSNRGIALVSVLWLLLLLTILASGLSVNSRSQARQSSNIAHAAQLYQGADAGLQLALLALAQPADQQPWLADGSPYVVPFDDMEIYIALFNESGRIDLNSAGPELLDGLLATAEPDDALRARLTDAIMDWRDGDDLRRLNGAEIDDYLAAGLNYGPANAPFSTVDELQQVLEMTPELYRKIRHSLTLRNPRQGINPQFAPRQVLLSLPGVSEATADQFIEDRRARHEAGQPPPATDMFPQTLLSGGAPGVNYTIYTESRMNTVYRYRLSASLLNRRGRPLVLKAEQEFIPLLTDTTPDGDTLWTGTD